MRVIEEIPHPKYKIQILNYNSKYILKIELDQFEQLFKIAELVVFGIDDIKKMITNELLENSLDRFLSMREDWLNAFNKKNN